MRVPGLALRVVLGVAIMWGVALLGGVISHALDIPVPGSLVGMILLWAALELGVVRLEWVDQGSRVLLTVLGLLFVPAGTGFIQFIGAGTVWLEILVTVIVGSLASLAVSAHVVQYLLVRGDAKREGGREQPEPAQVAPGVVLAEPAHVARDVVRPVPAPVPQEAVR